MLSPSLSCTFFPCFSLHLSPSPQSSSGNWEWAIKRFQTCAAWETRGRAIYFPLIYYKPSLSPLLCGFLRVRGLQICVWETRLRDRQVGSVILIICSYISKWQYKVNGMHSVPQLTWCDKLLREAFSTVIMILVSILQQIKSLSQFGLQCVSQSHG